MDRTVPAKSDPTLRSGDTGAAVGDLQQQLLERGFSIEQSELEGEIFGESTLAAVTVVQRSEHLTMDGIVGPVTWGVLRRPPGLNDKFTDRGWRCEPSQVRGEVRAAIEAAVHDLSRPTVEDPLGSNRGPYVDRYGIPGLPWCAAAASAWVMAADGHRLRKALNSAYKWRTAAIAAGWLLGKSEAVQPGDVGIIMRASGNGHVGLVVHVLDDGRLCSIEGNVLHAVRGIVRPRSAWSAFARPIG